MRQRESTGKRSRPTNRACRGSCKTCVTARADHDQTRIDLVDEVTDPEDGPVPKLLVAVTEHEYDMPLVNPVTVIGEAPPPCVTPPQFAV